MSKKKKPSTEAAATKPARTAHPMLVFGLSGSSYVASPKRFAEVVDAVMADPRGADTAVPTMKGVRPVNEEPIGDLLEKSDEQLEALARRFDPAAEKRAARTAARIKRLRARIAELEGSLES